MVYHTLLATVHTTRINRHQNRLQRYGFFLNYASPIAKKSEKVCSTPICYRFIIMIATK